MNQKTALPETRHSEMKSFPRWLIVALGLAMLALIGGGYWFYVYQEQDIRQRSEASLQAIVQLKVNLIDAWRAERLGDAAVLMESPLLTESLVRWMADPEPKITEQIPHQALASSLRLLQWPEKHRSQ